MKEKIKLLFAVVPSVLVLAVLVLSFGSVKAESASETAASRAFNSRTAIHISGSVWGYIDGTSFDNASWVWASMANTGSVTDREIPSDAGIISIDVSASGITATDRTGSDEVLARSYERAANVTTQSRSDVSLSSSYQYLIFLPAGAADAIAADGVVTKAEVTASEKLGSALVYTGSTEGNTVLGAVYLDGVLMNPEMFNSNYDVGSLYSVILGGDESSISTMYSFSSEKAANNFLAQNGIAAPQLMNALLPELKSAEIITSARTPRCLDNHAQFFEHKKYDGWGFALDYGNWNLPAPYNNNISSLRTQWFGTGVVLFDGFNGTGPFLWTRSRCETRPNLRDNGWNDRASSIVVY